MGHSWREIDPEGAAEHDRRLARHAQLARQIETLPLSRFMAADFPALARFWGLGPHSATDADMDRLEQRLTGPA
jgi:hypothetical protein